eukprot:GEMP01029876.1.p1 GENE.GEMP01029876.1~~GEMP01029876.1.p1  ORF type:complete len:263 (+),score=62.97 GEMP01029876.1:296-1084(+)
MDLSSYLSHTTEAHDPSGYSYPVSSYPTTGYPTTGYPGTMSYPTMQQAQQSQAQHNLWSTPQTTFQHPPSTQPAAMHGGRRFKGSVKSFSSANGYGFVASQEIMEAFGRDIFINQIEVDKMTGIEKSPIACGTCLSFTVVPNKRSQPQGRELQMENTMSQASLAQMAALQAAQMGFSGSGVYNAAMMQGQQNVHQQHNMSAMQAMGFTDYSAMPTATAAPEADQLAALQKFTSEVTKHDEDARGRSEVQGVTARDRSRSAHK